MIYLFRKKKKNINLNNELNNYSSSSVTLTQIESNLISSLRSEDFSDSFKDEDRDGENNVKEIDYTTTFVNNDNKNGDLDDYYENFYN